jgi:hypothetical protein
VRGALAAEDIEKGEDFGRGSWIRTNDLQYPKLPRYQAALYPDHWDFRCRYTLRAAAARLRRARKPQEKPREKPKEATANPCEA